MPLCVFCHQECVYIVAGQQAARVLARDPGIHQNGRRSHEVFCLPSGLNRLMKHLHQAVFDLNQGFFFDRGRGCIGVTASTERGEYGSDIYLGGLAPRDDINLVDHPGNRKDCV